MLNLEIRFVMQGNEVSVDSFVEVIVREVSASVREEISRTFPGYEQPGSDSHRTADTVPRQAVSVREAARLLSISPHTVRRYIGLKIIRTVRAGRRVLLPMKSVNEIVAKGIPRRQDQETSGR